MIRKGTLEGPFISVFGSSKNYSDLEDFSSTQKENVRKSGIFHIKIYDKIPLNANNSNYLKVSSVNLDFKPLNFDPNIYFCTIIDKKEKIESKKHSRLQFCDDMQDFLQLCGLQKYLKMELFDLTLNVPKDTTIIFSKALKELLGINDDSIEGPKEIKLKNLDLYKSYRPSLLIMPALSKNFVNQNMQSLAMVMNLEKIKGHGNNGVNVFFENKEPDSWIQIDQVDFQSYIRIEIRDSKGNILPFETNSELSIHFIIKSTPYDIL